jgi:hypothetical protein
MNMLLGLTENEQDALTLADISRICRALSDSGDKKCNIVRSQVHRADGSRTKAKLARNSRVDAGAAYMAGLIGNAAGVPAKYIALSPTSLTIAKGDTTLNGETAAAGLTRASATYGNYTLPSATNGTATFTWTVSYTNTSGSTVTILSIACFTASSGGTMLAEANLASSEVLNNGDSLNLVWTITV